MRLMMKLPPKSNILVSPPILKNKNTGFTLVELAVVLFLVGLMATLGLTALNAQMTMTSYSSTKKKQELIKDALIAYLGKNKRLPCPATTNDGLEKRDNTVTAGNLNCTAVYGVLPYATLDLPKNVALDGWESFFSYAVTPNWTLTYSSATPVAGGTTTNIPANSFSVGNAGAFVIKDRLPDASTPSITTNAVVFVISHGKNGLGALSLKGTRKVSPPSGSDELTNVPASPWTAPSAFFNREHSETAIGTYGSFDDLAIWLSPNDLVYPLIKDGTLKSETALQNQWTDQVASIKNAVIGYMFSPSNTGSCAPPNSTNFAVLLADNGISTTDPWGGTIAYTRNICRLYSDGASRKYVGSTCDSGTYTTNTTGYAFTITTTSPISQPTMPTINQLISVYQNPLQNCP